MSGIPPAAIGSVLQSGAAQNEQNRRIDAGRNADLDRARALAAAADAIVEIEETDADTRVHTDSGGAGSQGRQDSPADQEESAGEEETGITVDDGGQCHLDVSA